jgi:hypothetical protein
MNIRVEAIVPKNLMLDPKRLTLAVENALDLRAADVKVDFEVTTQTWNKRPDIHIATKPGQRLIYTDNIIYKYVALGTRPHIIVPRKAKFLRFFRGGFRPKTVVGAIRSNVGHAADSNPTRALIVHHPGTKARDFPKVIARKWQKQFPRMMQEAINYEASR